MNRGNGGTVKIVAPMTRKADVIVDMNEVWLKDHTAGGLCNESML